MTVTWYPITYVHNVHTAYFQTAATGNFLNSYSEEFVKFEDKISSPNLMGCGQTFPTFLHK